MTKLGQKKTAPPNLPDYILDDIHKVLVYRKNLGLPDDTKERMERALQYQESITHRKGMN